jgi:hypothetical protein
MPEITPSKYLVTAGWDDVPHLDEQTKRELLDSTPPHLRDARSKGIPSLGAGAIYPIPESEITVEPFEIPAWWPRAYGMDVGWNRTAAVWGALDPDSDTVYLYSEHYRGQAEPAIHAEAIKGRGIWIPGVIDPASRGRNQNDGQRLLAAYESLGLDLVTANNAVESGIYEVWMRFSTGRLKVFRTLVNWLAEYRIYRRDENGKIVKANDHLMDATRYYVMSGIRRAIREIDAQYHDHYEHETGRSGWTGY